MTTRIGLGHYTIANRGWTAGETLSFARTHQFDGVSFDEPSLIDASLDLGRLRATRDMAAAMSLYLEVGIPSPNPFRRSREAGHWIGPSERAAELEPQLNAVAALGCRHARAYIGDRHDRFRADAPWHDQVGATVDVLRQLTPRLKDLGVKVAIETHADLTGDELARMLEQLDPDVAGVTLDTGNLVMRLDDPVEVASQLASRVVATHVKDAVLAFTARGLCWQARPVGSGILPLPDILAPLIHANPALTLSIELHPRTYDLPIFDTRWLAFFPGLKPQSLATVVRLAALCENRYAGGVLPRPEALEEIPWFDRDLDWLASSLGYLRSVVPTLERI